MSKYPIVHDTALEAAAGWSLAPTPLPRLWSNRRKLPTGCPRPKSCACDSTRQARALLMRLSHHMRLWAARRRGGAGTRRDRVIISALRISCHSPPHTLPYEASGLRAIEVGAMYSSSQEYQVEVGFAKLTHVTNPIIRSTRVPQPPWADRDSIARLPQWRPEPPFWMDQHRARAWITGQLAISLSGN